MTVTIVGVRHHSPACARLVDRVIHEQRPAVVLIEGPSDMNDRLDELALTHTLPVALYSFVVAQTHDDDQEVRRASFYPFAEHSPEWVALAAAQRAGATARFIDLPAAARAFDEAQNRYSDHHLQGSERLAELCQRLGYADTDSLWDHLFEQPQSEAELAPRLHRYFTALRGDEPGSASDQLRERYMAQHIAWAAAQGADLVVVCGGYHAPALARLWPTLPVEPPRGPASDRPGRHGIYLVPFSFPRLDAFSGYAAGMPSPAFCAAVWQHGPAGGGERMLREALSALRAGRHPVSVADAIAATAMVEGLCRLRGHACPTRTDILDGIAAALVKEALTAPLPWTERGELTSQTHPILKSVLATFAGTRQGRLAAGTPRPPLVDDAHAELERVGVEAGRATCRLEASLEKESGRERSQVLHRLRVLAIPGVVLARAPRFAPHAIQLSETWEVTRGLEFDPALIEAATYGATLEQAAAARLEEAAAFASAATLADVVHAAAQAGLVQLSAGMLGKLRAGLSQEPDLSVLGGALKRLLRLAQDERLVVDRAALAVVLEAAFARGLWLTEALQGADAPAVFGHIDAAVALRDAVRFLAASHPGLSGRALVALAERRLRDEQAPPYLRGVAAGLRAALALHLADRGAEALSNEELVRAFRGLREPTHYGDFLSGLFALAREEVGTSEPLLEAILSAVEELSEPTFLAALPQLRRAMSYFPPRERVPIAERVLLRYGGQERASVLARIDVSLAVLGRRRELRAHERARRFGLGEPT